VRLRPLTVDPAVDVTGPSDEEIEAAVIGGPTVHDGPIHLAEYDPQWNASFAREADRIRAVLGTRAVQVEHVGSTSVPGLAAKPIIDIVLTVADSSDEGAYVPAMEAAGYELRIREPEWFEHRLFTGPDTDVNVHVFSAGCFEVDRMLRFRDHLRADRADRELYERTKRVLAARRWKYVQQYADAKSDVVAEIMTRAGPRPRDVVDGRDVARGQVRNDRYDRPSVQEQAEGMAGRVEHHPHRRLRLVVGEPRTSLDRLGDGCVQVVDQDLQVEHLVLGPGLLRPDRRAVPLLGLDQQVGAPVWMTHRDPTGAIAGGLLVAQEPAVELGELLGVGAIDAHPRPAQGRATIMERVHATILVR
jgi:GrpB-like predicted nucleotidyltransferase (UPF0157 family)